MIRKFLIIFSILIGIFSFSITGHCENLTSYNDDYVSFEYDADFPAKITIGGIPIEGSALLRTYTAFTAMQSKEEDSAPYFGISILDTQLALEGGAYGDDIIKYFNSDSQINSKTVKCIDENELLITYDDDNTEYITKLLYYDEHSFLTAIYSKQELLPENEEFVKNIYDSSLVNSEYNVESYNILKNGTDYETISNTSTLSEQALNYASEAIRIIKAYLSFEITGDEASHKAEELYKRVENYAAESDFVHDGDIGTILFLIEFKFDGQNDIELTDIANSLQALIDANH